MTSNDIASDNRIEYSLEWFKNSLNKVVEVVLVMIC